MYGYTSHFSSIQEIIKIFIVICWWVLISTHFLSLEKNHLRISKIFQYSGIGQIFKWQMLPGQLLPTHEWNLRRWFDKSHSNVSLIVLIILRDTSIEGTQTRKFFQVCIPSACLVTMSGSSPPSSFALFMRTKFWITFWFFKFMLCVPYLYVFFKINTYLPQLPHICVW